MIGVPHEKWGETPKALVVLRPGARGDEDELLAFCREHLAHFKCPTSVEFVDGAAAHRHRQAAEVPAAREVLEGRERKVAG